MSGPHNQSGLSKPDNAKLVQLLPNCVALTESPTTFSTDHGCPIEHNDDSLKAGARGPTLMEDFHLREKIMRFDHERIPERAVHARGTAAHGYFQVYEDLSELTKAKFLCNPSAKTPVFVRFSTVLGSRGSLDTARDVRGFAVKFYTEEGNFDLVGNNIPVFFVQDAIKFPDLVHAAKPEPHNEIPQAATAHDTFWDFISLMPESMHMVMWTLSDRAIPRSYAMMQGFGVHTFRFINAQGKARFIKFHWLPVLGVHSLVWDESQKIGGKDPDFHRRDLWEAIELGNFPEYELAVQVVEEGDEKKFDFDLLDPTKLIPEDLVPLKKIGRLVLNRNTTNFFAETEQVAFCVNNFVPGIGPTDDPLMQGRLFSYLDTQLTRLGGPNFQTIPINRPVCPVINFNSDGFHFDRIPKCPINYWPNSLGHGRPAMNQEYQFYREPVSGVKTNRRSPSFSDHFSQARLFYNSLSPVEKMHLIEAAQFELGKCDARHVVERVVSLFNKIDNEMATLVAGGLGLAAPKPDDTANYHKKVSPALSQLARKGDPKAGLKGRKVAVIALDGCRFSQVEELKAAIFGAGGSVKLVSQFKSLKADNGSLYDVDFTFYTGASVLFDALIFVGSPIDKLKAMGDATHWLFEAYKHSKTIGLLGSSVGLLAGTPLSARSIAQGSQAVVSDLGVVTAKEGASVKDFVSSFTEAMSQHRHWERVQGKESALWQQIPA